MAHVMTERCALAPAGTQHIAELARILYEAFKELHDHHDLPLDYPSELMARQVIISLVRRSEFYGVVALADGQPVGSNFLLLSDVIAGVGPLTVERALQGTGIGRALMHVVLEHAERVGRTQIRLMQETVNPRSLALYTSLGFEAREEVAYLQAMPANQPDPSVRTMTKDDLAAVGRLSTNIYRVSRRSEVAAAVRYGSFPLVREQDGRINGYLIPGINGHGVAETEGDAIALVAEMARRFPAARARFFCPLSEDRLFRSVLKMGCRIIKIWTLMSMGPYDPPQQIWIPSSTY